MTIGITTLCSLIYLREVIAHNDVFGVTDSTWEIFGINVARVISHYVLILVRMTEIWARSILAVLMFYRISNFFAMYYVLQYL